VHRGRLAARQGDSPCESSTSRATCGTPDAVPTWSTCPTTGHSPTQNPRQRRSAARHAGSLGYGTAQDVVVPARRERQAQQRGVDHGAGAVRLVEPVCQQELAAAGLGVEHLRTARVGHANHDSSPMAKPATHVSPHGSPAVTLMPPSFHNAPSRNTYRVGAALNDLKREAGLIDNATHATVDAHLHTAVRVLAEVQALTTVPEPDRHRRLALVAKALGAANNANLVGEDELKWTTPRRRARPRNRSRHRPPPRPLRHPHRHTPMPSTTPHGKPPTTRPATPARRRRQPLAPYRLTIGLRHADLSRGRLAPADRARRSGRLRLMLPHGRRSGRPRAAPTPKPSTPTTMMTGPPTMSLPVNEIS
jgi:hypothetical protein